MSNANDMPESVATVLARFPGPVTLKPSPLKWIVMVALALGLVAGGIFLIRVGQSTHQLFWGWVSIVFFGACGLVAACQLIPGSSDMTLDAGGFKVSGLRRRQSNWPDVANFTTWTATAITWSVIYDDQADRSVLGKLNRLFGGHNAFLPDTYGLRARDLARLMTLWRDRALKQTRASR